MNDNLTEFANTIPFVFARNTAQVFFSKRPHLHLIAPFSLQVSPNSLNHFWHIRDLLRSLH